VSAYCSGHDPAWGSLLSVESVSPSPSAPPTAHAHERARSLSLKQTNKISEKKKTLFSEITDQADKNSEDIHDLNKINTWNLAHKKEIKHIF